MALPSASLNPNARPFIPRNTLLKQRQLNIGHINICSLRNKMHVVRRVMEKSTLDLLAVTETWLDSGISDNEVLLPGTTLFRRDRPCALDCSCLSSCEPCKKGGGICIYVKDDVSVTPVSTYTHERLELMWIRIGPARNNNTLIGCIYRPPSEPVNYWDHLAAATEQLDGENVVLMGDINVDFLNQNSSLFKHLKASLLLPCRLYNTVKVATRITSSTRVLIDCILTNINSVSDASVFDCEFSDHRLVTSTLPPLDAVPSHTVTSQTRLRRDYRGFDSRRFCELLSSAGLHHFATTSVNLMLTEWTGKFNAVLDAVAPHTLKNRRRPDRKKCPFMTDALLALIRKRKSAFKRLKAANFQDLNLSAQFKRLRSQCNNMYRHLQNRYFADQCRQYEREPRQFWKVLNTITKRSPPRQTVTIPAEQLNDYFHSIVTDDNASYNTPMGPANATDLCSFDVVCVEEIKLRIDSLQLRKAPGPDGILPCLLKVSKDVIAHSLTILFNASLSSGTFPTLFKLANITPILKSGHASRGSPSNHRPVSLTSVLAKLLEQLVFSRLQEFFQDRCPFHEDQFGFRKHRSTAQLLTKVTNDWLLARDAGLVTAVVCIDLRKAFDTVKHQQLLLGLAEVGVVGTALHWFASYLRDRQQRVVCNSELSRFLPVSSGVPQGTILGPLLFNIYVRNLPLTAEANDCKLPMFADDMTLYASRSTPCTAVNTVSTALASISLDLQLLLPTVPPPILFQHQPLTQVDSTRILGVIVDCHLTWTAHVDHLVKKVCMKVGALRRSFRQLSRKAKKLFVLSVILPDLLYCCSCFLTKLSVRDRTRMSSLFRRVILTFAKFVHTNHVVLQLPSLSDLFPRSSSTARTRSHSNSAVLVCKFRTTDGVNSFSNRAALFFNALPVDWSNHHCTLVFAHNLHQLLQDQAAFKKYFDILFGNVST